MTSTRVIRPRSFKVDTTYAKNTRPVSLRTPGRLRADKSTVFQDIGAKLVRPKSRKQRSHLARSKGLMTSEGFAQQLVKEEGVKIKIGDSTLKKLLEIEVPMTRKQEYIKDDGSTGVRVIPVLDKDGNPILVKKQLSIPGSIEYFQKPIKEKLDDMRNILRDSKKSLSERLEALVIFGADILLDPKRDKPLTKELADILSKMPQLPDSIQLTGFPAGLIDDHIADEKYIKNNLPLIQIYLINKSKKRGLTPSKPIKVVSEFKDVKGRSVVRETTMDFDDIANFTAEDYIDLKTSIAGDIDDLKEVPEGKAPEPPEAEPPEAEPPEGPPEAEPEGKTEPEPEAEPETRIESFFKNMTAAEQDTFRELSTDGLKELNESDQIVLNTVTLGRLKKLLREEEIGQTSINSINRQLFKSDSDLDIVTMSSKPEDIIRKMVWNKIIIGSDLVEEKVEEGKSPLVFKGETGMQIMLTDNEKETLDPAEFNEKSEDEQMDIVMNLQGSEDRQFYLDNMPDISVDELRELQKKINIGKMQNLNDEELNKLKEFIEKDDWSVGAVRNIARLAFKIRMEEQSFEDLKDDATFSSVVDALVDGEDSEEEEKEEKIVEITPTFALIDPIRHLTKRQAKLFDENEAFKNLKPFSKTGKIKISNQGKNMLSKWLKTSTRKDVSEDSINSFNRELSAPGKQFDIRKLNTSRLRSILKRFNSNKVIIGSSGKSLEGTGRGSKNIFPSTRNFGYFMHSRKRQIGLI